MADIARLDFSKPPPGYEISEEPDADDAEWGFESGPPWCARLRPLWEHVEWTSAWVVTEAAALVAAWAHYKARHDQPGNIDRIMLDLGVEDWGVPAARWAWYERRLALAERLAGFGDFEAARTGSCPWWPACLVWSDEQVSAVERWIADLAGVHGPAELPEVLRE